MIHVRRRQRLASQIAEYKRHFEHQDGLTRCLGYTFGPDCFAHACTTRVYLPGEVEIRAVSGSRSSPE